MKKEMRTLLAAATFAVAGAVTAQAADIAPVTGHWAKFGADRSALVYYIDEPDGFHVVVTTQQGRTSRAAVERFETVLAAGQSAAVSIPRRGRSARADVAQQRRRPPPHRRGDHRRFRPVTLAAASRE
jgi:hypothetical protein